MDAVVSVFCGAGVLFLLFAIPRMVDVLPASVGGLLRAKELLNFENTMSLSRERDTLALLLLPLFVVALACYRVIPARLITGAQPLSALGWTALYIFVYLLCRNLCLRLLGPRSDNRRVRQVTGRSFFTFFVLLCTLMLLSYVLLLPFRFPDGVMTLILRRETELMYLIYLVRKTQILLSYNTPGKTFWYFIALEVIPALVLAALIVFC